MANPSFIVLEGPDKAGKSTQAKLLAAALRRRGFSVVHTREPGGTPLAEEIRRILLRPGRPVAPITELLLYEAARAQHVAEKIGPALADGKIVLCERFTLATLAYQSFGRGLPLKTVRALNTIATAGLSPGVTLVFDMHHSRFGARMAGKKRDRLEKEGETFQARVRAGYRALARGKRDIVWLDADRERAAVHADALSAVLKRLKR